MIRLLSWISASAIMVSGCAGPIKTRGETHQFTTALEPRKFKITQAESPDNRDLSLGRDLVATALSKRGYQAAPDGSILVHIALSDRPAAIAIHAGDKNEEQPLAIAKRQKRFQSCNDQEHRLTIVLFDQAQGTPLYSGNAAEYHCNGTIAQSLPFLIETALSGLDHGATQEPQSAHRLRLGVD